MASIHKVSRQNVCGANSLVRFSSRIRFVRSLSTWEVLRTFAEGNKGQSCSAIAIASSRVCSTKTDLCKFGFVSARTSFEEIACLGGSMVDDDVLTSQVGCLSIASSLAPLGMYSMPKPDFLSVLRSAHPALQKRALRSPSPSQNHAEPSTPTGQELDKLQQVYQKSCQRQRHAMLFLMPMPLTRNVQRVKGHTLRRQEHSSSSNGCESGALPAVESVPVLQQDFEDPSPVFCRKSVQRDAPSHLMVTTPGRTTDIGGKVDLRVAPRSRLFRVL